MQFFSSAIDTLQTLVVALGAGLGVWGVVNLLEGYGSDNPGAKGAENSQILKDYLEQNPLMQAAMDQRADAVQWTAWPGSALEAQQALIDMRDQILGGTKDVSTAMDECQAKVQGFIED